MRKIILNKYRNIYESVFKSLTEFVSIKKRRKFEFRCCSKLFQLYKKFSISWDIIFGNIKILKIIKL